MGLINKHATSLFLYLKYSKNYAFRKIYSTARRKAKFCDIPGPKSLPIVGTLYQYLPLVGQYRFDKLHLNGMKKYKKYGPVVKEEIVPGVNIVWLFKPEDIEIMFRNEGKYPQRRSHLALEKYRLDRPNVYNTGGLLPTNGCEWMRIRSVFQKGLSSPTSVLNFLQGSNQVMQEFIGRILEINKKNGSGDDFLPELSRLFLELTCLTILDLRLESFSPRELKKWSRTSKLIKSALETNSCVLKLDNGPQMWKKFDTPLYRKLSKAQKYMEDVAIDLLSLKMCIFKERKRNENLSLLDHYLSSPELDFKDIIGIVCDFLLAGIDTTTYTSSFMLYHLANNEKVQQKLYRECLQLLPSTFSPVTKDVLSQAKYAKAVMKESLRLRPVSVGVGRVLDKPSEFSGYEVPEDTVVVSQNQVSCRLEEYFTEPDEFIPERWLKDSSLHKQPHPFLLLPFGHGPRSCIARRLAEQNMLILLLKICRNFKIGWKGTTLDSRSLLINKPDGPVLLSFVKRH